jgi:RNA polymerase sigma-70 factor (ECF subfamily)
MITEQALLQRARRFDEPALIEVYDRFSPGLYRYAMRLLGDVNLAEDCVAETFSRFLFALKHGKGPSQHLQAYLYRVAHNWITDHYRRQPPPPVELEPNLHASPQDDPHQALVRQLESQKVRTALAGLTPDQRQVIVLKYLEDWENKAIAEALDKPVGAVKALQHRALNVLRRLLIGEEIP